MRDCGFGGMAGGGMDGSHKGCRYMIDGHVLTIFKNGSERDVAAALVAAISSNHPYATRLNSASPR